MRADGSFNLRVGQDIILPDISGYDSDTLSALDTLGRQDIATSTQLRQANDALQTEAFYQKYPDMMPITPCPTSAGPGVTCTMADFYHRTSRGPDSESALTREWNAAQANARVLLSSSGADISTWQGLTFNFGIDLDGLAVQGSTELNNMFAQFGLATRTPYDGLQAKAALIQAEYEKWGDFSAKHPITNFAAGMVGALENPLNRIGGGGVGEAGTFGGMTLRSTAFGAATGGIYGFGSGTDWDRRVDNALTGFELGGTIGFVSPAAGKYIFDPAAQAAKPLLNRLSSIRLEIDPNTLGSNFGNVRLTFGKAANRAPLDFSRISVRTGGDAAEHIVQNHGTLSVTKPNQGVFYGDPVATVEDAWNIANKSGLEPFTIGNRDFYVVPRPNSGYAGGMGGQLEPFHHVTIITETGSSRLVTGYPSGGTPPIPRGYDFLLGKQ